MATEKNERKVVEVKGRVRGQAERSLPTAWVPTWEVPVALKGADLAMKGGEKLVEWFRAEGPLSLQILDSRTKQEIYVVEMRATNMTVHGIYLDSFMLLTPTKKSLQILKESPIQMRMGAGFGGSSSPTSIPTEATLLHPGKSFDFFIEFPIPTIEDFSKTGWFKNKKCLGSGRIDFWILNEESGRTRDVSFSLRVK